MSKIAAFVAALGMNLTFVAAMAHIGIAFLFVTYFPHWWAVWLVAIGMGVKEFYFDARNETPRQTFIDNLVDWSGYLLGDLLAAHHAGLFRF